MTSSPEDRPDLAASLAGPLCRHLRSKKSYTLAAPARSSADVLDGSGHCWCGKTMLPLGPDDDRVDPDNCRAGRNCFETRT
jgi:hypothetical protein